MKENDANNQTGSQETELDSRSDLSTNSIGQDQSDEVWQCLDDTRRGPEQVDLEQDSRKERREFYIYYLRRPDKIDPEDETKGQPFYVGKGCDCRIYDHRKEAQRELHKSGRKTYKISIIHSLWKQGLDFEEDISIKDLTEVEAFEIEEMAICYYGRHNNGTGILANMTDGGGGSYGRICNDETKKKIGKANAGENGAWYGKHLSEETRLKISNFHKGKAKTDKHKANMSKAMMGRFISKETRLKMREAKVGKKQPQELIEKRTKSRNNTIKEKGLNLPWSGGKRTADFCEKVSKALKGKKKSPQHIENMKKSLSSESCRAKRKETWKFKRWDKIIQKYFYNKPVRIPYV